MSISLFLLATGLLIFLGIWHDWGIPAVYQNRACQGIAWKSEFPECCNDEIREFLFLFVDAFAFRAEHSLKFSPRDTVLSVYRALYPQKWTPDALELETLAKNLSSKYGIKLEDHWSENLTLGDLFRLATRSSIAQI